MASEIDTFASNLLEESKRFLEHAQACEDPDGERAFLHAALMLSFCALEAHINAVADDFSTSSALSVHERALILEREARLNDGIFEVTNTLRMARLEDRIEFLHRHFSGRPLDRTATWWGDLKAAMKLRNDLTHPKGPSTLTVESTSRAVTAILETLSAVFEAVYKRKFPPAARGLGSKLTF